MGKTTINNIYAVLFNAMVGILIALFTHTSPLVCAVSVNVFMLALAFIKQFYTGKPVFYKGLALAGLLKEIWIGKLMELFYPKGEWLTEGQNMSMWVDNNTINLADMGADPTILVNNTTYPIAITERTDGALALPLDYFDSTNTVVRNATAVQLAYNKLESVVKQHRNAMRKKNLAKAAHAYGPSANAAFKPVIDLGTSIIDNFIDMEQKFTELEVDRSTLICLLSPLHKAMLRKEDKKLYKDIFGTGGTRELYGFKIFECNQTPLYILATKAKLAFDATPVGTELKSSIFYSTAEVMYADGEYDMFSRLKDPEARGDIIGFQKRFLAMPIRDKYLGAIIGNALAT